jgi:hypothetical protein
MLGQFARLRRIYLQFDCELQENGINPTDEGGNLFVREILLNHAIDEHLARAIFAKIAERPKAKEPLEWLFMDTIGIGTLLPNEEQTFTPSDGGFSEIGFAPGIMEQERWYSLRGV